MMSSSEMEQAVKGGWGLGLRMEKYILSSHTTRYQFRLL